MMRHLAANGITLLIIGIVLGVSYLGWARGQYLNAVQVEDEVVFEVASGSVWKRTSAKLQDQGVISSAWLFRIGMRYDGLAEDLKAGVYAIPAGASMQDIAKLLSEGGAGGTRYRLTYLMRADRVDTRLLDTIGSEDFSGLEPEALATRAEELIADNASLTLRIAVPEGLTSWQIVEGLKKVPVLEGELDALPGEGALAPNTYDVRAGSSRAALIEEMEAAQTRVLAAAWEGRARDLPIRSAEELLILASIVEKETGVAAERPQVASVFVNRLNRGMRLQTDPTVIYGVTGGRELLGRGLRRSELDRRTPYNTYLIEGLPPTPIANPGKLALEAAANPDSSPYLFFVADGTGGHAFAETLVEHERNVAKWREIEAQRNN